MSKQTRTLGPWVNGWGDGLTGPTTPTGHPTCQEAVEFNLHCSDPKKIVYPKTEHTVVSCGMETIAIIPLNGAGGVVAGEQHARLIAAAPDLLKACKELAGIFPEFSMDEMDAADFKDRASQIWTASQSAKNIIAKIEETQTEETQTEETQTEETQTEEEPTQ